MRRRHFLVGAAAAFAGATRAQDNPWAALLEQYERPLPAFTRPFAAPPVRRPTSTEGVDVYDVTVRAGTAQPLDGAPTPIVGFDGLWPGATIVATKDRAVRVRLTNAHDRPVTIHNHGITCAHDSDGHPVDYVKPGATKEYTYPNRQPGGTFWLHDHAMGQAGENVYRGLAGLYLIRDPAEDALRLPRGAQDVPLIVQDRLFSADNTLSYVVDRGSIFSGHQGNALCVNGVHAPRFPVTTRRYRLRILNACNSRALRLALSDGRPLIQIASDGHLLAAPIGRPSIDLAASERCDVVVDFTRDAPGTSIVLRNLEESYPRAPDVLRFDVAKKERDDARVPERLATIARIDEAQATTRRTVRFEVADAQWTLNGLRYDPARVDFRPRQGSIEVWTLHNAESTQMHPFHQHLVPFQVLDVDGQAPPPHLRGFKDTVAVGPGATVRIAMRFDAPFTGVFVFHCHKLEHEDHAMMLQQEVVA